MYVGGYVTTQLFYLECVRLGDASEPRPKKPKMDNKAPATLGKLFNGVTQQLLTPC